MKRETLVLKLTIFLIGIIIIATSILIFPTLIREAAESSKKMAFVIYGILITMSLTTIPFFIALYQAYKLLCYIDTNKAFSELAVASLKNIKNCAAIISILYALSMPLFYIVGEVDDAPGVIVIGMLLVFAPLVISVFAAVLQKVLKAAVDIKNDNDLTI